MIRKFKLLVFALITPAVMAMDCEQISDDGAATACTVQHSLFLLKPVEKSQVEHEHLTPLPQPLSNFISWIIDAAVPGTYTDASEQVWNVSDYDKFLEFIGNRHEYALSSDPVRPEGVYTYPDIGMISVIYDFIKDNEQFFSLELTRIPDEYRIAREQENKEYRVMRDIQDREYQEVFTFDRIRFPEMAEDKEGGLMSCEDDYSRRSLNTPLPLTREQMRARNVDFFKQKLEAQKYNKK